MACRLQIRSKIPPARPATFTQLDNIHGDRQGLKKLGDGIYLIGGGYAAIAVDFKDHILIVEGGQSEQRSEAVIAEAKRLIPGKPIKEVVNTHPHFDHSGGLRTYVAEGTTIVTHESNKGFFEQALANPRTLSPDRLSQHPRKVSVRSSARRPCSATPANISPFQRELASNTERLQLQIDRIVPIHLPTDGRKVTLNELWTAVGKAGAPTAASK